MFLYDKLEKPLELSQIIILLLAILLFINNLELPAIKKYFNFRKCQRIEIWSKFFYKKWLSTWQLANDIVE